MTKKIYSIAFYNLFFITILLSLVVFVAGTFKAHAQVSGTVEITSAGPAVATTSVNVTGKAVGGAHYDAECPNTPGGNSEMINPTTLTGSYKIDSGTLGNGPVPLIVVVQGVYQGCSGPLFKANSYSFNVDVDVTSIPAGSHTLSVCVSDGVYTDRCVDWSFTKAGVTPPPPATSCVNGSDTKYVTIQQGAAQVTAPVIFNVHNVSLSNGVLSYDYSATVGFAASSQTTTVNGPGGMYDSKTVTNPVWPSATPPISGHMSGPVTAGQTSFSILWNTTFESNSFSGQKSANGTINLTGCDNTSYALSIRLVNPFAQVIASGNGTYLVEAVCNGVSNFSVNLQNLRFRDTRNIEVYFKDGNGARVTSKTIGCSEQAVVYFETHLGTTPQITTPKSASAYQGDVFSVDGQWFDNVNNSLFVSSTSGSLEVYAQAATTVSVNPESVLVGQTTNVSWTAANVQPNSCVLYMRYIPTDTVTNLGAVTNNGSTVSPAFTQTGMYSFFLVCIDPLGSPIQSNDAKVTVTAQPAAPVVVKTMVSGSEVTASGVDFVLRDQSDTAISFSDTKTPSTFSGVVGHQYAVSYTGGSYATTHNLVLSSITSSPSNGVVGAGGVVFYLNFTPQAPQSFSVACTVTSANGGYYISSQNGTVGVTATFTSVGNFSGAVTAQLLSPTSGAVLVGGSTNIPAGGSANAAVTLQLSPGFLDSTQTAVILFTSGGIQQNCTVEFNPFSARLRLNGDDVNAKTMLAGDTSTMTLEAVCSGNFNGSIQNIAVPNFGHVDLSGSYSTSAPITILCGRQTVLAIRAAANGNFASTKTDSANGFRSFMTTGNIAAANQYAFGSTNSNSASVWVYKNAVLGLSVQQNPIPANTPATLNYVLTNVDLNRNCIIYSQEVNTNLKNPIYTGSLQASGSYVTAPLSVDTTFTIDCYDLAGYIRTSNSVLVNIQNSPPMQSVDLKVNGSDGPITVPYGATVSLTLVTSNYATCNTTPLNRTDVTFSNVQDGPLTSQRTYMTTCTSASGSLSDSVVVNVGLQPPSDITSINFFVSCSVIDRTKSTATISIPYDTNSQVINYLVKRGGTTVFTQSQTLVSPSGGFYTFTDSYYLDVSSPTLYQVTKQWRDSNGIVQETNATSYPGNPQQVFGRSDCRGESDLRQSNKQILQINSFTPEVLVICDATSARNQVVTSASGKFYTNDILTFQIQICNTGDEDITPTPSKYIWLSDRFANMQIEPNTQSASCGGCSFGFTQDTDGKGFTAYVDNGTLPKKTGTSPGVWTLTFKAKIVAPSSGEAKFQNKGCLTYGDVASCQGGTLTATPDKDHVSFTSRYLPYINATRPPTKGEEPPQ